MLLSVTRCKTAFSLVEVVVALAVASFVLLVLVGTLPSGMKSVQDSMSESAQANITQQLRAQLEEITFNSSSTSTTKTNIFNLNQQTNYYTDEGIPTNQSSAYYQAVFAVNPASIPGSANNFQNSSAMAVQIVLTHPAFAASPITNTFSLLAAKQKSN